MDRPTNYWIWYGVVFGVIWLAVTLADLRFRRWDRQAERERQAREAASH